MIENVVSRVFVTSVKVTVVTSLEYEKNVALNR